jgi:hypothetical protein
LAVVTVKGIRAVRGPRSRTAAFLVKASLFSGLCLGVMVGGATAASAGENAHADKPGVSQSASASASSKPDSGDHPSGSKAKGSGAGKSSKPAEKVSQQKSTQSQKAVETEKPDPPKKVQAERPEKVEPAKPDKAAPAAPAVTAPVVTAPAAPDTGNASANATSNGNASANASSSSNGSSAHANSSSHANSASPDEHDSLGKGNSARHKNTHAVADEQSNAPSSAVFTGPTVRKSVEASGTGTTRDDARPRAPDADEAPDGDPSGGPSPAVPSPCSPPASSLTAASAGGVGGLRQAHAILPTAPDLSGAAAILVAQRDIGPNVSTRSAETTASPD